MKWYEFFYKSVKIVEEALGMNRDMLVKNLINVRRFSNEWFKWFKGIDES